MKKPTDSAVNPKTVNPKLLYALGALVVAVLLFVFVVNPMFLSGDAPDEPVALPIPATPEVTQSDEQVEDEDGDVVEDSLEMFNVRDPFHQLVPAAPGTE